MLELMLSPLEVLSVAHVYDICNGKCYCFVNLLWISTENCATIKYKQLSRCNNFPNKSFFSDAFIPGLQFSYCLNFTLH